MATTDYTNVTATLGGGDEEREREHATRLAQRYRCSFVDLREQRSSAPFLRT